MDLDHLLVKAHAGELVILGLGADEKVAQGSAVIALDLNHLAMDGVVDDSAAAVELLLDDASDFLQVVLRGNTSNGSQTLASISLCDVVFFVSRRETLSEMACTHRVWWGSVLLHT